MKQSSGARPVRSCSAAMALARAPASWQPVHGVHGMGVFHDGLGLVALELADEVPAELQPAQRGSLLRGLLVPVLPDVRDAERGEPPDVVGGMKFGDHDQFGRPFRPAGCCNGTVDALPDGGEPLPELLQPGIGLPVRGLLLCHPLIHSIARSPTSRRSEARHRSRRSPANRPVFGSRR